MQLEWTRFIEGITSFKTNQGMLWILGGAFLVWIQYRGKARGNILFWTCVLNGFLVLCPFSAVVLLKIYTPFYGWKDLQQLFPLMLLMSLAGVELFWYLKKLEIPGLRLGQNVKTVISAVCVVVLLLFATNFHGFDQKDEADEHGVPLETAEVFDALYEVIGDREMVIAAKWDMLQYARLYEPAWIPFYGRDLWNGKAASYINSGYDREYVYYDYLKYDVLPLVEYKELTGVINENMVDCMIVPFYWLHETGEMPAYDTVRLTDVYTAIIKKEMITK